MYMVGGFPLDISGLYPHYLSTLAKFTSQLMYVSHELVYKKYQPLPHYVKIC